MISGMKYLIDAAYLFAAAAVSPVMVYRMIRQNRYRIGWANRFGGILRKEPAKKCIWIHAVSVGEVNAAKTVVDELAKKPSDYEILITTTTDTGFARAKAIFGQKHTVAFFPLDFSLIMQRAFRNIKPAICLLMELEVWPNLVEIAHKLDIPVAVVNGRLSERSLGRYQKVNFLTKRIFPKIDAVFAQTEEYGWRFEQIGCKKQNVFVTGSLKYDTAQITDKVDGADAMAEQLSIKNARLLVAGATGDDEEKIVLDAYKKLTAINGFKDVRLAIVPRKPERFDEVAALIKAFGFEIVRYSFLKQTKSSVPQSNAMILGDTMGDLRKFYSLATVIFVGRSLVPMGGSDMMEAAALGKCTIFGPYAFNFKQTVDALLTGRGAVMVKDGDELLSTLQKCLAEPIFAAKIAQNGQKVIKENQGATAKTVEKILQLLNHSA